MGLLDEDMCHLESFFTEQLTVHSCLHCHIRTDFRTYPRQPLWVLGQPITTVPLSIHRFTLSPQRQARSVPDSKLSHLATG